MQPDACGCEDATCSLCIPAPTDILLLWLQVALHGGSPNKNIGDAFLLVWKFPKGFTQRELARMLSATDTDLVGSDLCAHSVPSVHAAWPSIPGSGVPLIAASPLLSTGFGFIRAAGQLGLFKPGSLEAGSDCTNCMHSCCCTPGTLQAVRDRQKCCQGHQAGTSLGCSLCPSEISTQLCCSL